MKSYGMSSFNSMVFCLKACFRDSSMPLHIPRINSFCNVEQYSTTICWIVGWVDGYLGWFQLGVIINKVTIITTYKSFCKHIFSILLDKYFQIELLGHSVDIDLIYNRSNTVL